MTDERATAPAPATGTPETRWRIMVALVAMAMALGLAACASAESADTPGRTESHYNLDDGLAIKGYDPVAYFPEGGSKPTKGSKDITTKVGGVTYRFASQDHLDKFKANPDRYEPTYGGWCAYAMVDGEKASIDPKSFIAKGHRLFLFYNGLFGDTRAKWLKRDHDEQAQEADEHWKKLTGEKARR